MGTECGGGAGSEIGFDSSSPCVFTRGLDRMSLPIRHGEGKLVVSNRKLLKRMQDQGCIPCRYLDPSTGAPTQTFPHNPNGSIDAIAGICDPTGHIFGLMHHPEAYLYPWNHPLHEFQNHKEAGAGQTLFTNAVTWLTAHT